MPHTPRIHSLERSLAELVQERQRLRLEGADAGALEANRREIVARQQELSDALIAHYAQQVGLAAA
jgi:hypothetical protein